MRTLLAWACLWAAVAHASDVGAELSAGGNKATEDNPRTGYFGALVNGAWDLSDNLGLNGAAGLTHDNATSNASQRTAGNNVWLFNLAGDWMIADHWLWAVGLMGSPNAATRSATTLSVDDPAAGTTLSTPAVVSTVNNSVGALTSLAFSTNGHSRWEHTVDGSASATRFGINQHLELPDAKALNTYCNRHPNKPVCRKLQPQNTELTQFRLELGYTATFFTDTDVGLEAAYYLYDHDPTDTSFYSVTILGRTLSLGESPSSIAPLQFTLKPAVTHRFGERVSVKLWVQYGQYVPGQGYQTAAGAKVQLKLSRHWKLYLLGLGQRDIDAQGTVVPNGSGVLGLSYLFD